MLMCRLIWNYTVDIWYVINVACDRIRIRSVGCASCLHKTLEVTSQVLKKRLNTSDILLKHQIYSACRAGGSKEQIPVIYHTRDMMRLQGFPSKQSLTHMSLFCIFGCCLFWVREYPYTKMQIQRSNHTFFLQSQK